MLSGHVTPEAKLRKDCQKNMYLFWKKAIEINVWIQFFYIIFSRKVY